MIDPNYPNHDQFESNTFENWKEFYPEAQEMLPDEQNKPDYLGLPIRTTVYKGSDHAHDLVTRRSVTGILLLVNNTPVNGLVNARRPLRLLHMEQNLWQLNKQWI